MWNDDQQNLFLKWEGIFPLSKYEAGEFVSMDQFVVSLPDHC